MEEGRAKISDKEEYPPPEEIAVRQRVQLPEKVMLFKRNYKLTHFTPARSFGADRSAPAPEWLDVLVAKFPGVIELSRI